MGDIAKTDAREVEIEVDLRAHAGIERVELRCGSEVLETIRPYTPSDLGNRVRFIWSGAKYRGRGRNTPWKGRIQFEGTKIVDFRAINFYNLDRTLRKAGSNSVVFDTLTTGNFMGFDVWLEDALGCNVDLTCNWGDMAIRLSELGIDDQMLDAGGLDRKLRVLRLPETPLSNIIHFKRIVKLKESGDTPVWISAITEDGFQAWSTPIYLHH